MPDWRLSGKVKMKYKYLIIHDNGYIEGSNKDFDFVQVNSESNYCDVINLEQGIIYSHGESRKIKEFKGIEC